MKNILICFGTRPEYIKVKSLIDNMTNIRTCFTGQHSDLLKNIKVDFKLEINNELSDNRLNNIICNILKNTYIFNDIEYVLVQGDTTTACAIALSAFNHSKKVIHLEAGLRTGDLKDPFPEEMNRQVISRIADIHLCPTEFNKKNLERENVNGKIYVVGNTGLDNISKEGCIYGNQVLITMHRRDNHDIMDKWFEELEKIANKYNEIEFVIPLHPNPNVQKHKHLFKKVKVVEPMSHEQLIDYVKKCKFVISDSGGLQEECSYLNKKIIVCRKTTERPESVGVHSFMCEKPEKIGELVDNIMNNYEVNAECPYGDGMSWKNIKTVLFYDYWNVFYKLNSNFDNTPSTFFNFVMEYLKDYPEHKTLIDIGCGNGRDLIHFSKNGLNCTGIDCSEEACKILKKNHNELNIICDSFVEHNYKNYDIYYSRFSLHSISYNNVLRFIKNISEKMNEKSLLFIETRSIKETNYEIHNYYEANFKSGIGCYHNRTLFNKKYLIELFNEKDIFVEYEFESNGLSPYKGEDPCLIRLVLRKVNINKYMESLITTQLETKQFFLKKNTDVIIKILENANIKYGVFFGNLIGLVRHNDLFIPWDDDVDLVINAEDKDYVIDLLYNNIQNIGINITETTIIINYDNLWLDIFYDIQKVIKSYEDIEVNLDLSNYEIINNYKIPKNYKVVFDVFYKNYGNDFMKTCVIYNHEFNNRWCDEKKIKININPLKINEILEENKKKKCKIIDDIMNDLIFSPEKISDICIFIIPTNQDVIKLVNFIKTLIFFHSIDTYILVNQNIFDIIKSYVSLLKKNNIFILISDEQLNVFNKNICKLYLKIKQFESKYENILIYNDFPIINQKFTFVKNIMNNVSFEKVDLEKNYWFTSEIKKDNFLKKIDNVYSSNYNGLLFKYNDFINLFEYIDLMIEKNNCTYPFLEVYIATFIKKKFGDIKVYILDNTIWNNENVDYCKKYFSITYK